MTERYHVSSIQAQSENNSEDLPLNLSVSRSGQEITPFPRSFSFCLFFPIVDSRESLHNVFYPGSAFIRAGTIQLPQQPYMVH